MNKILFFLTFLLLSCSAPIHQMQESTPQISWKLATPLVLISHSGSAVAIYEDSEFTYLITARHIVVSNNLEMKNVTLTIPTRTDEYVRSFLSVGAETVAVSDEDHDLALIRSKIKLQSISKLSNTYPKTGQTVYTSGYPMATVDVVITKGIISRIQQIKNTTLISTTAPVLPGNSGGGIFNEFGECIGVVQNIMYGSEVYNSGASSQEVIKWLDSIGYSKLHN